MALSQLNRSVESRGADSKDGKRPQLSDLRESGAIEQDADIVCFIHRPEYYLRSGTDAAGNDIRGLAEFIVAKHRSGAVDDVKMRFRSKYARFENWDGELSSGGTGTYRSRMNEAGATPAGLEGSGGFNVPSTSPFAGGTADILAPGPDDSAPF